MFLRAFSYSNGHCNQHVCIINSYGYTSTACLENQIVLGKYQLF